MSSATQTQTADAKFPTTPDQIVNDEPTYTLEVTEANKTETNNIQMSEKAYSGMKKEVTERKAFRSDGQLFCDAMVFYLDNPNPRVPIEDVRETVEWGGGVATTYNLTPTLFNEINAVVYSPHTEFESKQEFQMCALYNFSVEDMPKQERR